MPKVHALYVEHRTGVDETVAAATKFADEQAASFASTNALAPNIALGIALLAIALVAIVGKLVLRRMDKQLGTEPYTAVTVARRIASGNLAEPIAVEEGDTKSLMAQLKTMQESLATTVGRVRDGSDAVAASSAQIAQGNGDLSARTEQQASALEETAASMGQLSNTVKQNADSARQANQLAMSASSVAVKGGEVVAQVVDTMKSINDSSRKISDIIGVIDGIAFQTNILALNAAVEAARAGEQGRGFAVVASEVRNLAGRSAEAAKEIKNLIGDSVQRVEQGTAQVDQAGATMTEVVASIKRVTDLMGEISAASSEQSAGVAKVGQAVAEMDSNTQQNAALVEEMAASAEGLKNQAHALVQTVSVFQLGGKSAAKAAPGVQSFTERRGPNRATNVQRLQTPKSAKPAAAATRPPAATVAAKTGTTDEWTSF